MADATATTRKKHSTANFVFVRIKATKINTPEYDKFVAEYGNAMEEYKQDYTNYICKLTTLLNSELPDFISEDYIDEIMYEKTPEELVQEMREFFDGR